MLEITCIWTPDLPELLWFHQCFPGPPSPPAKQSAKKRQQFHAPVEAANMYIIVYIYIYTYMHIYMNKYYNIYIYIHNLSCNHSFCHSFFRVFIESLTQLSHSFRHSFFCAFIHSFIHSIPFRFCPFVFIHLILLMVM